MPQLHGAATPLHYFPGGVYLQNGVEVVAELPARLAGNTRYMSEWLGQQPATDTIPCAPISPSTGLVGHDHSGGVMGTPLQHTVWQALFGHDETVTTTDVKNGLAPRQTVTSTVTKRFLIGNNTRFVFVPGCPVDGAYVALTLGLTAYASAAATLTVEWRCANMLTSQTTSNLTAGAVTSAQLSTKLPVIPGVRQVARLDVFANYVAASSTVSLLSVALHQTATAA